MWILEWSKHGRLWISAGKSDQCRWVLDGQQLDGQKSLCCVTAWYYDHSHHQCHITPFYPIPCLPLNSLNFIQTLCHFLRDLSNCLSANRPDTSAISAELPPPTFCHVLSPAHPTSSASGALTSQTKDSHDSHRGLLLTRRWKLFQR